MAYEPGKSENRFEAFEQAFGRHLDNFTQMINAQTDLTEQVVKLSGLVEQLHERVAELEERAQHR